MKSFIGSIFAIIILNIGMLTYLKVFAISITVPEFLLFFCVLCATVMSCGIIIAIMIEEWQI